MRILLVLGLVVLAAFDSPPAEVSGNVTSKMDAGQRLRLHVDVGAKKGVAVGWVGNVVDAKGKPLRHHEVVVKSVSDDECVVELTARASDLCEEGADCRAVRLHAPVPASQPSPRP